MSLPSHMSTLGSLRPSDPVVTSVPAADWAESDSDSPSFIRNKPEGAVLSAALTFGQKTYDGSAARTLTAADIGALTSHQDISGKVDSSALFSGGKVKAELLPSYVDDVLEYPSSAGFPSAGEAGKIYVAKDTNKTYRWSGTQYVEISPAPDLSGYAEKSDLAGVAATTYADDGSQAGPASATAGQGGSAFGYGAKATGSRSTSAGYKSEATATAAVAVGFTAKATANHAMQLGSGTNATANTLQFRSYQLLDANGRIPLARLPVDSSLSTESENPVQNKVVKAALDDKQNVSLLMGLALLIPTPEGYFDTYEGWLHKLLIDSGSDGWPGLQIENAEDYTYIPSSEILWAAYQMVIGKMTAALALKADATSLPYALVDVTVQQDGEPYLPDSAFPITFYSSASGEQTTCTGMSDGVSFVSDGMDGFVLEIDGIAVAHYLNDGGYDTHGDVADISFNGQASANLLFSQTATLTDRAINAVSLAADATLAFPAPTTGKARDFVVRLTLTETGGVVPSVTFPADVAYETEGGEWPDLTAEGTYIVRLTEVPTASESETARFFLQCSSAVDDATPPSAGGGV